MGALRALAARPFGGQKHRHVFLTTSSHCAAQALANVVVPGRLDKPEDLAPGEGAVQQAGKDKVAVYKDEDGTEHTFAAACPHLGCLVQWNPLDGTFGARSHCKPMSACDYYVHVCGSWAVYVVCRILLLLAVYVICSIQCDCLMCILHFAGILWPMKLATIDFVAPCRVQVCVSSSGLQAYYFLSLHRHSSF